MDEGYFVTGFGILVGIVIGIILSMMIIFSIDSNPTFELGNAICDQEYGMEFDSYDDKELKCKSKQEKQQYDGIIVDISNEVE